MFDRLDAAITSSNATRINDLLTEAIETGISGKAVDDAHALLGQLSILDDKRSELKAAEGTLQVRVCVCVYICSERVMRYIFILN